MSKIEVNQISSQCGSTLTIGQSGDTVTLAAGATQSGFGRTGTVDWDTTAKTASFTAVSGNGYFVNTTSGAITVTTPASPSAGDIFSLADYAATWDTNNLTVSPNGTDKIGGTNAPAALSTKGQSVTFVYVDSTQGWLNTMDSTSNVRGNAFMIATGGTITTCGDYKIHTFTGPGTFTVCTAAPCASNNTVDYLVVAGGGSGGSRNCHNGPAAGGAGGFRYYANTTNNPQTGNPAAPLNNFPAGTAITVTATAYPITVGGGGTTPTCSSPTGVCGTNGSNSVFSTITSAGGGFGARAGHPTGSGDGGSGGGGPSNVNLEYGEGNTPPTSPPQGNPGGNVADNGGGGGGGAGAAGGAAPPNCGGDGGAGVGVTGFGTSGQLSSCKYYFAGGGGGGSRIEAGAGSVGTGGIGGGAPGNPPTATSNGTANTGGGGGGGRGFPNPPGDALRGGGGGSGIVIIRYKYQ